MATEKTSLESLKTKLVYIPGGVTIYDASKKALMVSVPTQISQLQTMYPGDVQVSVADLLAQGIQLKDDTIQYVYPQKKQSLVSFLGTLPHHTLVFLNPSEDPSKHTNELSFDVYQTVETLELNAMEPATLTVVRVSDSSKHEISRLGHFISLIQLQQKKILFPPSDLRLFLPPVHIPSQHLGDCAADTVQTCLFFADGFYEVFAELANQLYKQYIQTEPNVIFGIENPKLVDEIRRRFKVKDTSQQAEDCLYVFASMVRRFILVRLLDYGTDEELAALKVPQTKCALPSAVRPIHPLPGRRKSVNLLAGSTIALRLSRIFNPKSMFTSTFELKTPEINLQLEAQFYCLVLKLFNITTLHSMIINIKENSHLPNQDQIKALIFSVLATSKKGKRPPREGGGHAVSMFQNGGIWYLQDDNTGIARTIPSFNLKHFIEKKGDFFIRDYEFVTYKTQLIELGFFTEEELKAGKAVEYTFYGYEYREGNQVKEKILHMEKAEYGSEYMAGAHALSLVAGDVAESVFEDAIYSCKPKGTAEVTAKKIPRLRASSISVKEQISADYEGAASRKPLEETRTIKALRKNIQRKLNSFTNTRRIANASSVNTTRKRGLTPEMISQLNSF